jgi:hypothetical protein
MNRWKDWRDQGERDLRHARHAFEDAHHERQRKLDEVAEP